MPPKLCGSPVVPIPKNGSLISIRKFCNKGYVAIFGKRHLCIIAMDKDPPNSALQVLENKYELQGHHNPSNGLWSLHFDKAKPFDARKRPQRNSILARESLPDFLAFPPGCTLQPNAANPLRCNRQGFPNHVSRPYIYGSEKKPLQIHCNSKSTP